MTYMDGGVLNNIDMLHTDHCDFSGEIDFTIVYNQPEIGRANLAVCAGWNLISFPFVPNSGVTVQDAVPTSITDGYWFDPVARTYVTLVSPETGKGFWVYCTEPDTFPIAGMLVDMTEAFVQPGWNMIGMPWESSGWIPLGAMTVTPSVLVTGNTYGFDACGSADYFTPDSFQVGQGYWILASGEGHVEVEGDSTATKSLPIPEPSWVFEMQLGDKSYTIGLDDRASVGIDGFDRAIPPLNPDGGERFGGIIEGYRLSRDVRPGERAEFEIDAEGILLHWNAGEIPDGIELVLINAGRAISMSEKDEAVLEPGAKIIVERRLPFSPELYSAVPNPFNATVEIGFALPEESDIDLTVFDVLGKSVDRLAAGEFSAGTHTIIWDGTDDKGRQMSSGIYFYRLSVLKTGETLTGRMVLLK